MIQRFKYAGGTLDIVLRDNPLFRRGMRLSQRIMYLSTFWSYLGCLWNVVFLAAPIVYLFTGIAPLSAYSGAFYLHALPFILLTELAFMVGTWGVNSWDGKASLPVVLPGQLPRAWTVLRGEKIKFHVTPKERQEGTFLHLVSAAGRHRAHTAGLRVCGLARGRAGPRQRAAEPGGQRGLGTEQRVRDAAAGARGRGSPRAKRSDRLAAQAA